MVSVAFSCIARVCQLWEHLSVAVNLLWMPLEIPSNQTLFFSFFFFFFLMQWALSLTIRNLKLHFFSLEDFHGSGKPDGAFKSILLGVDDDEEVKEVYSPSMELQSISCLLQENINAIRSPLESVVTTDTFLDVEGKGKENFEEQYMLFLAGVQRMEIYVCNYLKVTLSFAYQTDLLIVYHSFFS